VKALDDGYCFAQMILRATPLDVIVFILYLNHCVHSQLMISIGLSKTEFVGEVTMRRYRRTALSIFSTMILAVATEAFSATLETSAFISSSSLFNGFEAIASSPNFNSANFLYSPANTPYSEGGITVEYVGSLPNGGTVARINSFIPGQGQYGWYGPGYGYTDITLTNGGAIDQIQFLAGSGFGNGAGELVYELRSHGLIVLTGSIPIRNHGNDRDMTFYGFSGGGFDEVRLQVLRFGGSFHSDFSPATNPDFLEAVVIDSVNAVGTVPEASTWTMIIFGFAAIGLIGHRRRDNATIRAG
jgi:hypothetical protein